MNHLSPEQLLDVAEGTRTDGEFPHLHSCATCARQLAELRGAIDAAAGASVPEPSPLFWHHLSERIRAAVAEEPGTERAVFVGYRWWRFAAAAAVIAVVVFLAAPWRIRAPDTADSSLRPPNEATQTDAVPAFDDDPALTLLADLSAGMDWESAAEAGLVPADGAVDTVVLSLSAEERTELHRILQEALAAPGA